MIRYPQFINFLKNLNRLQKIGIVMFIDALIVFLASYLAFYLRLGYFVSSDLWLPLGVGTFFLLTLVFGFCRVYDHSLRFSAGLIPDIYFRSFVIYFGVLVSFILIFRFNDVPRTVGFIQPVLVFAGCIGMRFLISSILMEKLVGSSGITKRRVPVLVYGVSDDLLNFLNLCRSSTQFEVRAIVNDLDGLVGSRVCNVNVISEKDALDKFCDGSIEFILCSSRSRQSTKASDFLSEMASNGVSIRNLPSVEELVSQVPMADWLRPSIADLLGRPEIPIDDQITLELVKDKTVLVTGAGGSIGGELCSQIAKGFPRRLILVDMNEFNLYAIERRLREEINAAHIFLELVPALGSATDVEFLQSCFENYKPRLVFHAAAYKHVPIVEQNPMQGLRNNILATKYVLSMSKSYEVEKFVLISSDKAVNPTNVMGLSKRICELMTLGTQYEDGHPMECGIVRFGNVLNSSGSVIPLFEKQIDNGGPITITHPEVTRYFMSIEEACGLVLRSASLMKGGDIFVLDMGQPVKIVDLANQMLRLKGLNAGQMFPEDNGVCIEYIGLRPGEKMYEELFFDRDKCGETSCEKILTINESIDPVKLQEIIASLSYFVESRSLKALLEYCKNPIFGYRNG